MKKVISLILSIVMIFGLVTVAFAGEENNGSNTDAVEYDGYPLVIVRGMDLNGIYYEYGTENQEKAFKGVEAKDIISVLFKAIGQAIIHWDTDYAVDVMIDYADEIMCHLACNKDGSTKYNVSAKEYTGSVANYPELGYYDKDEDGITKAAIEKFGADNVYFFNYDWRIDPYINAGKINTMVNRALEETGKDKVNIICCSMGGILTYSYMYKYGYDKINRVIFDSSTFCGTEVTGDLLRAKFDFRAYPLYRFLKENAVNDSKALDILWDVLYKTKIMDGACKLATKFIDEIKDKTYHDFMRDCWGTMPVLWAITDTDVLDEAIEYMFGDDKEEYAGLLDLIEQYRKMNLARDEYLRQAEEDGVSICVVAGYNRAVAPCYSGSGYNGDTVIDANKMLGNAKVAFLGETLGDDYTGERVSADKMVDLSNCLFPETTWAINGSPHVAGSYGTDMSEFYFTLIRSEGRVTVDTYEKYPQFMNSSSKEDLSPQFTK